MVQYRIDFEYYSVETGGTTESDSFEVVESFKEFLQWIADNDITNYTIKEIVLY